MPRFRRVARRRVRRGRMRRRRGGRLGRRVRGIGRGLRRLRRTVRDITPETKICYFSYQFTGDPADPVYDGFGYMPDEPYAQQIMLNKQDKALPRGVAGGTTGGVVFLADANTTAISDYGPGSASQWAAPTGGVTGPAGFVPNTVALRYGLREGAELRMRKMRLQVLVQPPIIASDSETSSVNHVALTRWKIMLVRLPKVNNDQPKVFPCSLLFGGGGNTTTNTYNEPLLGYYDFSEEPPYTNRGPQIWVDDQGATSVTTVPINHRSWWSLQGPRGQFGPVGRRCKPRVLWMKRFKTWNQPTDEALLWNSGGAKMGRDEKEFRVNIKFGKRGHVVYDDDYAGAVVGQDTITPHSDARPRKNALMFIVWNDCPQLAAGGTVSFGTVKVRGFWTFKDA